MSFSVILSAFFAITLSLLPRWFFDATFIYFIILHYAFITDSYAALIVLATFHYDYIGHYTRHDISLPATIFSLLRLIAIHYWYAIISLISLPIILLILIDISLLRHLRFDYAAAFAFFAIVDDFHISPAFGYARCRHYSNFIHWFHYQLLIHITPYLYWYWLFSLITPCHFRWLLPLDIRHCHWYCWILFIITLISFITIASHWLLLFRHFSLMLSPLLLLPLADYADTYDFFIFITITYALPFWYWYTHSWWLFATPPLLIFSPLFRFSAHYARFISAFIIDCWLLH